MRPRSQVFPPQFHDPELSEMLQSHCRKVLSTDGTFPSYRPGPQVTREGLTIAAHNSFNFGETNNRRGTNCNPVPSVQPITGTGCTCFLAPLLTANHGARSPTISLCTTHGSPAPLPMAVHGYSYAHCSMRRALCRREADRLYWKTSSPPATPFFRGCQKNMCTL